MGAIVGGVIGALALVALSALAFLCLRRRRRHRNRDIPPSAEFMRIARGDSPSLLPLQHDEYAAEGGSAVPLSRQSSLEDDERPPAFTSALPWPPPHGTPTPSRTLPIESVCVLCRPCLFLAVSPGRPEARTRLRARVP